MELEGSRIKPNKQADEKIKMSGGKERERSE